LNKTRDKEDQTQRQSKFRSKNKQFSVWLPENLFNWFNDYLDAHSSGESRSAKMKDYLYRLQVRAYRPRGMHACNIVVIYKITSVLNTVRVYQNLNAFFSYRL